MSSVPTLYISVGATGAMFTLRETYTYYNFSTGMNEKRSFHIKNLGQNSNEAYEKAFKFALDYGVELTTTPEMLNEELRKIHRSSKEEIERRKREQEMIKEENLVRYNFEVEMMKKVAKYGYMPVGKYVGYVISEIPADFCELGIEKFEQEISSRFNYIRKEIVYSLKDKVNELGDKRLVLPKSLYYLLES